MPRYQGFEVEDYVFTLDALPLKPSFFCNTGVKKNVAASTQNQALNAIVFLYKQVLKRELGVYVRY